MLLVWIRQAIKLARYRASYFIEYIYPRNTVIFGVPTAVVILFLFVFVQSGLAMFSAEFGATRLHVPTFCRFVRNKDACMDQFYTPKAIASGKFTAKVCRALSGRHVIACLVAFNSAHPAMASCQILRQTEGDDSIAYYWCLGNLPASHLKDEACHRAEVNYRWNNMFYARCLTAKNINNKIPDGRTYLMQYLVFERLAQHALRIGRDKYKYKLPLTTKFADLLDLHPDLNAVDKDGRTALFYVHDLNDLKALLAKGPLVNHQDRSGVTAPMIWMNRKDANSYGPFIAELVKHGYKINLGDKEARTVLVDFVLSLKSLSKADRNTQANLQFVEELLRLGANPYLRDKSKKRAIDYARDLGLTDMLRAMYQFRKFAAGETPKLN